MLDFLLHFFARYSKIDLIKIVTSNNNNLPIVMYFYKSASPDSYFKRVRFHFRFFHRICCGRKLSHNNLTDFQPV